MIYNELGRTGLKVSAIGIGAGGPSRLGLANGRSSASAIRLIRFGLDRGINVLDTAAIYGTEDIIGTAIQGCRPQVVLSTKAALGPFFGILDGSRFAARLSARIGEVTSFVAPDQTIEKRVHESLRRLRTDYIDIFHLHAVTQAQFELALQQALPPLLRLKESGKIRWIGITEAFPRDRAHQMLKRASATGLFDCIMIGSDCLNQTVAPIVTLAKAHRSGVMGMHAIRGLSGQKGLQVLLDKVASCALIGESARDAAKLLRLLKSHGVTTLAEAAIRFSQHELKADVLLSGTGDAAHLDANIAAVVAGPLPDAVCTEFRKLFSKASETSARRLSFMRRSHT